MRQFAAGDSAHETEIVFDARRRAGLAAGGVLLDQDRRKTLGASVHRGCKAGRPAADDHDVVFAEARDDRKAQRFGKNLKLRLYEGAPIGETYERARRRVDAELRNEHRVDGVVEVEPFERHLVPREKVANRVRSRIEIAADHDRLPRAVRSVSIAENRHATNQGLGHKRSCCFGLGNEQMEIGRIQAHQPRWLQRANRDERLGAENDGELAEEFRRIKCRRLRLAAAHEPYAFHFPRENDPQIRGIAFARDPFPRRHQNLRGTRSNQRPQRRRHACEQRNLFQLVGFDQRFGSLGA